MKKTSIVFIKKMVSFNSTDIKESVKETLVQQKNTRD